MAIRETLYRLSGGQVTATQFKASLQSITHTLDQRDFPLEAIRDVQRLVTDTDLATVSFVNELRLPMLSAVNAIIKAQESSPAQARHEDNGLLQTATDMQNLLRRHHTLDSSAMRPKNDPGSHLRVEKTKPRPASWESGSRNPRSGDSWEI